MLSSNGNNLYQCFIIYSKKENCILLKIAFHEKIIYFRLHYFSPLLFHKKPFTFHKKPFFGEVSPIQSFNVCRRYKFSLWKKCGTNLIFLKFKLQRWYKMNTMNQFFNKIQFQNKYWPFTNVDLLLDYYYFTFKICFHKLSNIHRYILYKI